MGTLLPELEDIAEEIAARMLEVGFDTPYVQATQRQRVEWFALESIAAAHALDGNAATERLANIAFAEAHFEPGPKSVLSPGVAFGFNLEAMAILAEHAKAHYRHDTPGLKRALRAIVALFEESCARCSDEMQRLAEAYKESIIEHGEAELPVFTDSRASWGGADTVGVDELSEREQDVFRLVALGYDNASIGRELFLSESTVKSHVRNILVKTKLKNRTQLALLAVTSGMVSGREINRALLCAQDERSEQLV